MIRIDSRALVEIDSGLVKFWCATFGRKFRLEFSYNEDGTHVSMSHTNSTCVDRTFTVKSDERISNLIEEMLLKDLEEKRSELKAKRKELELELQGVDYMIEGMSND